MRTLLPFVLFVLNTHSVLSGDSTLYIDASGTNLPLAATNRQGMDGEAADFNGDGWPDFVIAVEYFPNVLLFNNGFGLFADSSIGRLPQKNLDSEDIAIADLDNDGDLDLVFATEDHMIHEMYLNNGNGSFADVSNLLPGSRANSVLAAYVNNDSFPDLIFGNAGTGDSPAQNFILINNGDATFVNETAQRLPALPDITQDIKLGDLDADGDLDMVVGNEDGNKLLLNNGAGVFTDSTAFRLPLTGTEETRKVSLGDIDNDNDLDIFFANVAFRAGRIRQNRLLINDGSGYFSDETSSRLPVDNEHTPDGIFIDVDLDGDLDLVTANIFFNRPVKIFINDGNGIFEDRTSTVLPPDIIAEGIGLKAADFNGDGLLDIYVINRRPNQPGVTPLHDRLLLHKDTTTVGVRLQSPSKPGGFRLHQNYPNPFNPETSIKFEVPGQSHVALTIHDVLGRIVATLTNGKLDAGTYRVDFNGGELASGMYWYRLQAGEHFSSKAMLLFK